LRAKGFDEPADTLVCKFLFEHNRQANHANQRHFYSSAHRCKQAGRRHDEFSQAHVCHEHGHHRRRPDNRERVIYRRQIDDLNVLGSIEYLDSVEVWVGPALRTDSV
jgi:hypothetical protein